MRIVPAVAVALLAVAFACDASAQGQRKTTPLGPPEIKRDVYSPTIDVVSNGMAGEQKTPTDYAGYLLVGKIDKKSGSIMLAVQWAGVYTADSMRYYNRASDSAGTALPFETARRHVNSCGSRRSCVFDEVHTVYFTKEQIAAAMLEGLDFKIYARDSSSAIVKVSAASITAFAHKMIEAERLLAQ